MLGDDGVVGDIVVGVVCVLVAVGVAVAVLGVVCIFVCVAVVGVVWG